MGTPAYQTAVDVDMTSRPWRHTLLQLQVWSLKIQSDLIWEHIRT